MTIQGDDEMEVESGESDSEEDSDEEEEKEEVQRLAPIAQRQMQVLLCSYTQTLE